MSNIVTFGEVLMRLSPPNFERIIQTQLFETRYSGAEVNVAISLAYFGDNVRFVSRFPDNVLGEAAENSIRHFGVDTTFCLKGGNRLGTYYSERGASLRASAVLYDRQGSAFSQSNQNDYDWKEIFKDSEWFHLSGINLAIGDNVFEICHEACKMAKTMNVKVCLDINYRSKLISEKELLERIMKIIPYVDLLVGNESEIAMLAERNIPLIELEDFEKYIGKCYQSAVAIQEKFGTKTIACSLRKLKSASELSYSGLILDDDALHISNKYDIKVVEMIGCGDAFVAGLLHSFIKGKSPMEALNFAVGASCLKHTIEGDYNLVKEYEVEKLITNYAYGIVQR